MQMLRLIALIVAAVPLFSACAYDRDDRGYRDDSRMERRDEGRRDDRDDRRIGRPDDRDQDRRERREDAR